MSAPAGGAASAPRGAGGARGAARPAPAARRAPARFGLDPARPAAALAILALALLSTAGLIGLTEPTETRYAEIAREMLVSGDPLRPRLNGLVHFHKPPLAYWAAAAGMAALGPHAWGARVPVALASALALLFTALAVRRRFGAQGLTPALGAWLTGSALLFAVAGRALAADAFLAAAVAAFWALAPSPWALLAIGAGFLAKGPVVLLPTVAAVLAAAALGRERGTLRLLGPAWGWALAAALGLGWYAWLAATTPGLAAHWLGDQLWARYATTAHGRPGPPGYFVAVLLAGLAPWTPALFAGLARAWRERARAEARLLLAWLLVPLVVLSFSGSKLPAYLLPALPAAALLAGIGLAPPAAPARLATAGLLAMLAVAGWVHGPSALGALAGLAPPARAALPPGVHVGLACLLLAASWVARGRIAHGALLVTLAWVALAAGLAPHESRLGSPRHVARLLADQRRPSEPVVLFARFNAGIPFALGETVRLLEVPRETRFDDPAAVARVAVTRESLAAWADAGRRIWIFGPEAQTADMAAATGLDWRPLARWRDSALGIAVR
uniref:Glycosyltransferase RgtA/B/C/D-like domain-containing protein n=1 Tax=Eiseniibacteriota bacterium TaxID=2212470 RepID=A0A832I2N7_UNCEI